MDEDKPNKIVRLRVTKVIVSLHQKLPFGVVDHFAVGTTISTDSSSRPSSPDRPHLICVDCAPQYLKVSRLFAVPE
jgi:hypothetical protein